MSTKTPLMRWMMAGLVLALASAGVAAIPSPASARPEADEPTPVPPRPAPERGATEGSIGVSSINPATAAQLAAAMGIAPGDILVAELMGSDPNGVGVSDAALGNWFPTQGSTFAILSTGLAADASRPNTEESWSSELIGLDNTDSNDLVRLHLQLAVPSSMNCVSFDFIFYSEEFFEFIGSPFNDTFTTQLNNATLGISGTDVVAPGNFSTDPNGDFITVNAAYLLTSNTGTTYDGATPQLTAKTAVTPSSTIDLYFSIQDMGDSVWDSTVFLDNFLWLNSPSCPSGSTSITFLDVPTSYWAWSYIEAIAGAGLTSGYPDLTFRPNNPVTRAEMAVFLKKGIHGSSYTPPAPNGSSPFSDLAGHWAEAWMEDLYDEGMTVGYPDGTYRPENQVTRAEMAVFLLKAEHGSSYFAPAPGGGSFSDVAGHWAENWIEQLKEEGITSGYPDGTFRPENSVTRAEMAVFLVQTFNIPMP